MEIALGTKFYTRPRVWAIIVLDLCSTIHQGLKCPFICSLIEVNHKNTTDYNKKLTLPYFPLFLVSLLWNGAMLCHSVVGIRAWAWNTEIWIPHILKWIMVVLDFFHLLGFFTILIGKCHFTPKVHCWPLAQRGSFSDRFIL